MLNTGNYNVITESVIYIPAAVMTVMAQDRIQREVYGQGLVQSLTVYEYENRWGLWEYTTFSQHHPHSTWSLPLDVLCLAPSANIVVSFSLSELVAPQKCVPRLHSCLQGKHYVCGVFDFTFQRKWVERGPESENAVFSVSSVSVP